MSIAAAKAPTDRPVTKAAQDHVVANLASPIGAAAKSRSPSMRCRA